MRMELTAEQQIGQMLWFGWQGETPQESLTVSTRARALLEEFQVGGVILMGRNVRDPRQVAELTTALQSAAPVPLFIGTDQEGGMVARLPLPGLTFPGNMALGALDDPDSVTAETAAIGEQLSSIGINVDFAPVLDVNNNPANPVIGVRSFGEDPERVARLGVAALRGFAQARVISCVKHFPGHGDTAVDSHLDLPVQTAPRSRLDSVELAPFRAAVAVEHPPRRKDGACGGTRPDQAGAPLLMTAHIRFPALDDRWPATLSRRILTDLLRAELGYNGVVVTDCLEMKGIADHFGVEEAAITAVEAGADCLLVCHTLETQRQIREALLTALRDGRLSRARIESSVERILRLKAAYDLADRRVADPASAERVVGAASFRDLERDLARRAVTIVRDDRGWLPLPAGPIAVTGTDRVTPALAAALREAGMSAEALPWHGLDEAAGQTLLLTVLPADPPEAEGAEIVRRWLKRGARVIVLAAREPYPLSAYRDAPCQVATYGYGDCALLGLADVLVGRARPQGSLPVTVADPSRKRYNSETDIR
jgi:beta-N-acetylhexosaminidase